MRNERVIKAKLTKLKQIPHDEQKSSKFIRIGQIIALEWVLEMNTNA